MGENGRNAFRFLLDGLGDPRAGREITGAIFRDLALPARCDPAGMWLEVETPGPMTEETADKVAFIARQWGLEVRDRVGTDFSAGVTEEALVRRLAYEWTSRFATALVFLFPALLLHYLTPRLATGSMFIPRFLEAALVGWSLIAACWPVLYQAGLSVAALKMTPDLYAASVMAIAFGQGVFEWLTGGTQTDFHAVAYAIIAACLQRMIVWRTQPSRTGAAHLMMPTGWILLIAMLLGCGVLFWDFDGGLALLLAVPSMLAALTVNRLLPGMLALFPVLFFGVFLIGARWVLPDAASGSLALGRIEAGFGFCALLTLLLGLNAPQRRTA